MARLEDMHPDDAAHLLEKACPTFAGEPWVQPPALGRGRVAVVTTAGLHLREDPGFDTVTGDYRVIPGDVAGADLVMSHASVNFDRTGFQQDINVVFPIDRLRELEGEGTIGSLAHYHYAFMSAFSEPHVFEPAGCEVGRLLRADGVDVALLLPV